MSKTEVKETTHPDTDNEITEKKVGRLPENTISYFKRVDQMLDESEDVFNDNEHKETFLRNVYVQIEDSTTQLLRHTVTSKVLEKIIPLLSDELYIKFLTFIQEDLEKLMTDRFASHVIETSCLSIQQRIDNKDVVKLSCKVFKNVSKSMGLMIRDTYATHVVSTLLQVYTQTRVADKVTSSKYGNKTKKPVKNDSLELVEVTSSYQSKYFVKNFEKYVEAILTDDNFGELLSHRHGSSLLQVLLLVTSKKDREICNKVIHQILTRLKIFKLTEKLCDDDEDTIHRLPAILIDEIGSHLFEMVLRTAEDDIKENLISKCFTQIIATLCLHPVGNFTAQLVLRTTSNADTANTMVGKVLDYMEDILACGHMGCVVATTEVIVKHQLKSREKEFCKVIKSVLHIPEACESKPLVKLIICLLTYDIFFENADTEKDDTEKHADSSKNIDKSQINYHGILILKNCFLFGKNKIFTDSFLCLSQNEFSELAKHIHGGFLYESFYKSENISDKKKTNLSEKLFNHVDELSCDKYGSRVVDAIWNNSNEEIKTKLQVKLTENKLKLLRNMFGRIVLSNCQVYKNQKFQEKEETEKRKRKFVEDIIPNAKPKTEIVETEKEEPKKTKKEKDRAEKYRKQLQSLGITV